jgi:DNA polymerase III gamma/tau subunit
VGLDKLNVFAEICLANDLARVFSHLDEILDAGVAVEQLILDLSGYYHSLLLIKAGVTRESIPGYPPERFSVKVLEKLDAPRLAHAGELLFDLHRDIRYSVSPRFELRTLASKLCWLDRWISPPDLAEAVKQARVHLKAAPRPLAKGAGENSGKSTAPESFAGITKGEGSPFVRAIHENNPKPEDPPRTVPKASTEFSFNDLYGKWQADKKNPNSQSFSVPTAQEESSKQERAELNPAVQSVLRIFNGTIINKGKE